ncbi:MAG: FAD:protein FMN transferase [Armatimonadetes bacterium]|nr:FAD:protein FMN transferase [Armatimonadota bacterium]
MGVQARIVMYDASEARAVRAARAAFDCVTALDASMSDYKPDSELNRLCKTAVHRPTRVSRDLFETLRLGAEVAERSSGAFDITVGPLVGLWRAARKSGALPGPAAISEAKRRVGRGMVRLRRNRTVELLAAGMRLDLGGIAKGYACDAALAALRRLGRRSALVEMGGDLVVGDAPPGADGWRVEVANPGAGSPRVMLTVARCGVSTSGDTEQFVEIGGKRYSHVVDPATGMGLTTRCAATVIAPCGALSDALSTAACVLGPDRGRALVAEYKGSRSMIRAVE